MVSKFKMSPAVEELERGYNEADNVYFVRGKAVASNIPRPLFQLIDDINYPGNFAAWPIPKWDQDLESPLYDELHSDPYEDG